MYQPLGVEKGLPWKIPNSWSFWLISYIDRVSNLNLAKTKTWDSVAYLLLLLRVGGAVHIGSHDENRDGEGEKDKRILGAGQKTKFAIGSNRDIQGGWISNYSVGETRGYHRKNEGMGESEGKERRALKREDADRSWLLD